MRKLVSRVVVCILAVVLAITVVPMSTEAKSANRIELNCKSKVTICQGETISISVKGIYRNGKKMSGNQKKVWKKLKVTSSDKSVAVVSKDGKVTAKKKGQTTIRISLAGNQKVKTSIRLTVKGVSRKPAIVLSKKSADLNIGGSITIKVKSVKGLSSKSVTFKSDNKKVATVNKNGKVTAKGAGTATITVTSATNRKIKATFEVSVDSYCEGEHAWSEWDQGKVPTCTEEGSDWRECKLCGEIEYRTVPALGHDWVVKEHVDVAKGTTGGDKCVCSRCKEEEFRNKVYYQPTEEELLASINSLRTVYPTGSEWEYHDMYGVSTDYSWTFEEGDERYTTGNSGMGACGGFAIRLSNEAYGENVPFRTHHDASKVRVGDIVDFEGDSINHVVIVIGFTDDGGWITAEGNVGGRVAWNVFARKMVGSDLYTAYSAEGKITDGVVIKHYNLQSHNTKISVYTRWK